MIKRDAFKKLVKKSLHKERSLRKGLREESKKTRWYKTLHVNLYNKCMLTQNDAYL